MDDSFMSFDDIGRRDRTFQILEEIAEDY